MVGTGKLRNFLEMASLCVLKTAIAFF